jgi:hypothetical protein
MTKDFNQPILQICCKAGLNSLFNGICLSRNKNINYNFFKGFIKPNRDKIRIIKKKLYIFNEKRLDLKTNIFKLNNVKDLFKHTLKTFLFFSKKILTLFINYKFFLPIFNVTI